MKKLDTTGQIEKESDKNDPKSRIIQKMGNTKLFKYKKLKNLLQDDSDVPERSPCHTSKCFDVIFKKSSNKTSPKSYQSLKSAQDSCLLNNKRQIFAKNDMIIVDNLKSTPYNLVYSSSEDMRGKGVPSNSKLYKFVKKILKRKLKVKKRESSPPKNDTKLLCSDPISTDETSTTPLWYHEQLSRHTTTKILEQRPSGSFIIRQSSKRNCYALSLAVANTSNFSSSHKKVKVIHFLILEANNGFKIKGCGKVFQSLEALVTHHSVMPEVLPVTLMLPKSDDVKEYYVRRVNRKVEDYDSFEQLRKVLEEVEISAAS